MRTLLVFALAAALAWVAPAARAAPAAVRTEALPQLLVLAYHDIVPDGAPSSDPDAVSVSTLARHFAWLELAGFTTVSLREMAQARAGTRALPARPVLLMFDDGYASFPERVLPLLRAYGFKAVLAPVAGWLEPSAHVREEDQSGEPRNQPLRATLMTRAQVVEVAADEHVELASHTFDLHHGERVDPAGAVLPAASAPRFDPVHARFESVETFEARLRDDLRTARERTSALAAQPVNALVWPYGRASLAAERIAREAGFEFTFTLGDAPLEAAVPSAPLARKYITRATGVADFAWYVRRTGAASARTRFVLVPSPTLETAAFAAYRDAQVAALRAAGITRAVLLPASPETLAQCRFEPAALTAPDVLARANHLAWHLMRRAGVELVVALPGPACLERQAWRAMAARLLETRVLDAAQVLCAAVPAVPGADSLPAARQWLRARYPGLPVHEAAAQAPCVPAPLEAEPAS
jgi:biofilm PGA synthesis lipoprotein PgaB